MKIMKFKMFIRPLILEELKKILTESQVNKK